MSECPKCGSRRINGPRYVRPPETLFGERLRYTCARCGFIKDVPTRDATDRVTRAS